jgi:hypothetical protein
MSIAIFWDIARQQAAARSFHTWLIFYPEDGNATFLRNVGSNTYYTVRYIPEEVSIYIFIY